MTARKPQEPVLVDGVTVLWEDDIAELRRIKARLDARLGDGPNVGIRYTVHELGIVADNLDYYIHNLKEAEL